MPFTVIRYDSVDSTQELAKKLSRDYMAVVAREMKKGRGRMQRPWLAPPGGLWLSLTYPYREKPQLLSLAAGVAVVKTFRELGLNTCLKWPNDVMVHGLKIAGILSELYHNHVIVGIGINLNNELPDELYGYATTAKKYGLKTTVEQFLQALLPHIEKEFSGTTQSILAEWKKNQCTLGREIKVIEGTKEYRAVAEDIDDNGFLVVRVGESRKTVNAGDIRFIQKEDATPQSS